MIGYRASMFFDPKAVSDPVERARIAGLKKLGAYIRQTAQKSIGLGKGREISQPGRPPVGHAAQVLKTGILFDIDPGPESVVIGPVRLNKPGQAPKLLEHGGDITLTLPGQRRPRTLHYRARPFMGPAADTEIAKMDPIWRDSVRS